MLFSTKRLPSLSTLGLKEYPFWRLHQLLPVLRAGMLSNLC